MMTGIDTGISLFVAQGPAFAGSFLLPGTGECRKAFSDRKYLHFFYTIYCYLVDFIDF
jgi:hypothetical protein